MSYLMPLLEPRLSTNGILLLLHKTDPLGLAKHHTDSRAAKYAGAASKCCCWRSFGSMVQRSQRQLCNCRGRVQAAPGVAGRDRHCAKHHSRSAWQHHQIDRKHAQAEYPDEDHHHSATATAMDRPLLQQEHPTDTTRNKIGPDIGPIQRTLITYTGTTNDRTTKQWPVGEHRRSRYRDRHDAALCLRKMANQHRHQPEEAKFLPARFDRHQQPKSQIWIIPHPPRVPQTYRENGARPSITGLSGSICQPVAPRTSRRTIFPHQDSGSRVNS